jgi:hypothetical protein
MFVSLQNPEAHALKPSAEIPHVNLPPKDTQQQSAWLSLDISIFLSAQILKSLPYLLGCAQISQKPTYTAYLYSGMYVAKSRQISRFSIHVCSQAKSYYKNPDGGFRFSLSISLVNVPSSVQFPEKGARTTDVI